MGLSANTLDHQETEEAERAPNRGGLAKGVKANRPRHTRPLVHDPGGVLRAQGADAEDNDAEERERREADLLPTTVDLAQSFLQTEPLEEKVELQAAIAQSQYLQQSQTLSEDGEEDLGLGVGSGPSLPGFLAAFLKGVGDRLEVRINGVKINVDLELTPEGSASSNSFERSEAVTMRLAIENIDIEGVTCVSPALQPTGARTNHPVTQKENISSSSIVQHRRISLRGLQGMLISDASLFTSLSRLSAPSSPATTHTSHGEDSSSRKLRRGQSYQSQSSSSSAGLGMTQSTILQHYENTSEQDSRLEASIATNDKERFADAAREDVVDDMGPPPHVTSPRGNQDEENGLVENSGYINQTYSRIANQSSENPVTVPEFAHHELATDHPVVQDSGARHPFPSPPQFETGPGKTPVDPSSSFLGQIEIPSAYMPLVNPSRDVESSMSGPLSEVRDQGFSEEREEYRSLSLQESHHSFSSQYSSSVASPVAEDLTQSKLFSHEEAQSMYMSAISRAATKESVNIVVPGGWDPSSSGSDASGTSQSRAEERQHRQSLGSSRSILHQEVRRPEEMGSRYSHALDDSKRSASPGPQSGLSGQASQIILEPEVPLSTSSKQKPALLEDSASQKSPTSSAGSRDLLRVVKHMLYIDWITLALPQGNFTPVSQQHNSAEPPKQAKQGSIYPSIPGAFSIDVKTSASQPASTESNLQRAQVIAGQPTVQQPQRATHVETGQISILSDIGLTRLLLMIVQQLKASLPTTEDRPVTGGSPPDPTRDQMTMKVAKVSWKLLEVLEGFSSTERWGSVRKPAPPVDLDVLLGATVEGIDVVYRRDGPSSSGSLSLSKFAFGYAGDNIISFDSALKMRESTRDVLAPVNKDINLSFTQTSGTSNFELMTLPIHISLDLRRLDETFSWFGGFSSILGLGSSMVSTVKVADRKPKSTMSGPRTRGVHFETPGDTKPLKGSHHHAQGKLDMRLGGFVLDLQGRDCMVRLETTAIKLVNRLQGLGVTVDKLKLSGPHLRRLDNDPSIQANLVDIRIKYLSTPEENDLDRLLELLSPSKDKYEQDDDILLDTLLRQRRQGGVLRIAIQSFKGGVSNLDDLEHFPALAEELSKLSTVTKYLPEDDRPGLLTLGRIADGELKVKVSRDFGDLNLVCNDVEVANVTFPALTALGIQHVRVRRNNTEELLAEALSLELRDIEEDVATGRKSGTRASPKHAPMIMARMIGDEMEPTVKIKLWNVRVEYRVPTIMTMMGIADDLNTSAFVADMVSSVATLTSRQQRFEPKPKLSSQASFGSNRSSTPAKYLKLDVAIRDSVIGLNPRNSPARGLVVLTNTHVSGVLPKDDGASATLEIRKASLMVVDDVKNVTQMDESSKFKVIDGRSNHVDGLSDIGYVSLSYISAASVILNVVKTGGDGERSIDVEVRDELFVLESCADSTQTLLSVLNGLQPPMPPSKEIKYRTEVMPVEDMLGSLSGDAFATAGSSNTNSNQYPLGFEEGDMMDDEVPQNLEFVSSFYNPDAEPTAEQIADSMLEDDLGSLASPPITREIGAKVLLQSFLEQYEVAPGREPLDFREGHFGEESAVGGTAHRWDTKHNTYGLTNELKVRGSPLKVRVRDVHIIWNLFDGYDWQHTRDTINLAVADLESKAAERTARKDKRTSSDVEEEEESVIGDFLFNSIYIGIPANRDPLELARQVNRNIDDLASETESYATTTTTGSPSRQSHMPRAKRKKLRLNRSKHHKMTFELKGVAVDLVVFSPGSGETQSSIDVRIQDLEIFDHVPTSTWKKFATYMHEAGERESSTSMIHLEILNVKPVPDLAASEIILKVSTQLSHSSMSK